MSRFCFLAALLVWFCFAPTAAPLRAQPALAGPEIQISPLRNASMSLPVMASRTDGGFLVIWVDNQRLLVRAYDAEGKPSMPVTDVGPTVDHPFFDIASTGSGFIVAEGRFVRIFTADGHPQGSIIPIDTPESAIRLPPRIATDRNGGFVVVWGGREGDWGPVELFLRRFSALGEPLEVPRRLIRESGGSVEETAVAATPDGEILVAWNETIPYKNLVFGQIFGLTGGALSPPFSIGQGTFSAGLEAIATGDGFLTAWLRRPPEELPEPGDGETGIYGRLYDRLGNPKGDPFLIEASAGCCLNPVPALLADASGHAFVSWISEDELHLQEIHDDGSLGLQLSWSSWNVHPPGPPDAAGWGDGELAVVWEASGRIFAQRFASGSSQGVFRLTSGGVATGEGEGPVAIRVERREGNLGEVSVDYTLRAQGARAGKDFLPISGTISFADGESASRDLSVPILDDDLPERAEAVILELSHPRSGARLGAPSQARIEIRDDEMPSPLLGNMTAEVDLDSTDDARLHLENPRVAALANGGLAVLWDLYRGTNTPDLMSKLFDAAGREIAHSFAPTPRADSAQIVAHPASDFTIVGAWDGGDAVGQRFSPLGQPRTEPFALPAPLGIAAARAGRLFTLTESDSKLWLNTYGGSGQSLGPPQAVSPTPCFSTKPVLASKARGQVIIAWRGPWPDCDRILVRRTDTVGHLLRRTVALEAPAARNIRTLAMAAAPDGGFVLVWEGEGDDSDSGIFGRLFAADGRPTSGVFQVNGRRLGTQGYPGVAMQEDGRFLVIFMSYDKLHAQYFSSEGRPLGSDFLPDSRFSEHAYGLAASLATDAAGRYVVVWTRSDLVDRTDRVSFRWFVAPRNTD